MPPRFTTLPCRRFARTLNNYTDDDNAPNAYWAPRTNTVEAEEVGQRRWLNVYRLYSREVIWPRGFPLNLITDPSTYLLNAQLPLKAVLAPIQQGIPDNSPDVDAIWRLTMDRPFNFERRPSVYISPGTWCPFNSQSTWWWPSAYPLLYLPSFCSFRMTDIWRSFIAQRCLWELGHGIVYHSAEVVQERNVHDLLRDFSDEVPGYLNNGRFAEILTDLTLRPGPEAVGDNLLLCYKALTAQGLLCTNEQHLVEAWLEGLSSARSGRAAK